jgi:hypothetical protein
VSPKEGGGRSPAEVRVIAVDERRLFVEAEREPEVEELREGAWTRGLGPGLLEDTGRRRPNEDRRRKARLICSEGEVRPASAADRVEVDRRHDPFAEPVVRSEALGSEAPVGAGVGGQEEDRVVGRG